MFYPFNWKKSVTICVEKHARCVLPWTIDFEGRLVSVSRFVFQYCFNIAILFLFLTSTQCTLFSFGHYKPFWSVIAATYFIHFSLYFLASTAFFCNFYSVFVPIFVLAVLSEDHLVFSFRLVNGPISPFQFHMLPARIVLTLFKVSTIRTASSQRSSPILHLFLFHTLLQCAFSGRRFFSISVAIHRESVSEKTSNSGVFSYDRGYCCFAEHESTTRTWLWENKMLFQFSPANTVWNVVIVCNNHLSSSPETTSRTKTFGA